MMPPVRTDQGLHLLVRAETVKVTVVQPGSMAEQAPYGNAIHIVVTARQLPVRQVPAYGFIEMKYARVNQPQYGPGGYPLADGHNLKQRAFVDRPFLMGKKWLPDLAPMNERDGSVCWPIIAHAIGHCLHEPSVIIGVGQRSPDPSIDGKYPDE